MYKNLEKALKDLNITQRELSSYLQYNDSKTLHLRIKKNIMFKETEKEKIYKYLKNKGYKGKENNLFVYSDYVEKKKEKSKTHFSIVLDKYIKDNNTTNEELAEKLNCHPNTISNWRSGKIDITKLNYEEIDHIAKTLKIPVGELIGYETYTDEYINKEFENRTYSRMKISEEIYNILINYQINVRNKGINLEINNHFKTFTLKPLIEECIKSFNLAIDDKFIKTSSDLEKNKDYKDTEYLYEYTLEKIVKLRKELDELENNPQTNDEDIRNKEKEIKNYIDKFGRYAESLDTKSYVQTIANKRKGE